MRETGDRAGGTRPNLLPTAVLLVGTALAYGAIAFHALLNGRTSAEEVAYLIKSWWYVTGAVAPYTATDATGQMPLYFYLLGFWQELERMGHIPARLLSVGLGVVNGALLFFICRRLTANTLASAAAVFMLLATPATIFFFAAATPTALVSALHLGAVWLIVANLGRQRPLATVVMGLLLAAIYFTRQNMLLGIIVLAPLYIAAIGRKRALHTAILLAAMALLTAALLFSFPEKLGHYALRLPVISPLLESAGLLAPNFTLIDQGTLGAMTMGPAFGRAAPVDILDNFLLPYSGTVLLALLLFVFARGGLRVLWIAPVYFLWLAASHYLASLGYCGNCILSYAPYFSAIGALAGALALAMIAHRARQNAVPAAPCILIGAVLTVALNTFAPGLAVRSEARDFPVPMMSQARVTPELREIENMARWVAANAAVGEPVLVLHSMGAQKLPSLPYTVFLAGRMIPPQSIDPAASRRVIDPRWAGPAREAVQAAVEEESLWTDATFTRWIERDYDVILFQEDASVDQRAQLAAIRALFNLAGSVLYRGAAVHLYKRKAVQ